MSRMTPKTMRSRTATQSAARRNGYTPPRCPRGCDPLEDDLPDEEHERPRHVRTVGEECAVAGVRPLLLLHPAHGEDHLVGLARQQVPAAGAAVDEEAPPGGQPALDLGAVGRSRAGHDPTGLLLHPPER